jgi:recombination protein RecA
MTLSPEVRAWMAKLNGAKNLGPGTVLLAVDMVVPRRFTSGSLGIDVALGGGWPGDQWVEVLGPESSGKTAVTLKTVAANQKTDKDFTTFWLAAEKYDTDQATALGVDNSRVVVAPTQKMEVALDLILDALESKLYDCIILDSFPALLPDLEEEKAMDEPTVAVGAKLFNKFWRKAGDAGKRDPLGSERPFLGIVINQFRDKIGGFSPYGTPQTSPGGHGKDYAFYTRLKVNRDEFITEKRPGLPDPVTVGQRIVVKTIKNKGASPQQTHKIDFYTRNAPFTGFRRGDYDLGQEFVTLGVLYGVIQMTGSWCNYDGQKWGPAGKDEMAAALREDAGLQEKLAAEVLEVSSDPHKVEAVELAMAADAPAPTRRKRG